MPPTVFRDAEALLIDHLADALPDLEVYGQVPDPRPGRFATINRLGGVRRNAVTDGPMVTFECWANDLGTAMDDAQDVRAEVHALVGQVLDGSPVYKVDEIGGPARLPAEDTPQDRVAFTVEVLIRGSHP